MTEAPLVGLWCTGKNPLELAVSVHCSRKVMDILKNAGYGLCSCYTEITLPDTDEKFLKAVKTLRHLCNASDLILSFGCTGFSEGDIIPGITEKVCTGKVTYFSNVLCGSVGVKTSLNASESGKNSLRIYPDDDIFEKKASARGIRKQENRFPGSFISTLSTNRKEPAETDLQHNGISGISNKTYDNIKLCPSRATAGIYKKALVLNFSNDVSCMCRLTEALLPAIGFTVYNISGKSAALYLSEEVSLKNTPEFQNFFINSSNVNT